MQFILFLVRVLENSSDVSIYPIITPQSYVTVLSVEMLIFFADVSSVSNSLTAVRCCRSS